MKLENEVTRDEVLKFLSSAVLFGNLGLFIGAGFSKAVLDDELKMGALSWAELIEATSKKLGIDYSNIYKDGLSYPEISTKICEQYAEANNVRYEEAKLEFKNIVCSLTNWSPNKEEREQFTGYFKTIKPSWVITTNYDLVVESLLTGQCISLGPEDFLVSSKDVIPVYHLHGIRINPESIIINQEDYVKLFRPNEYRQIKLALTMKESTTLILGYGLGDVNVLTAVDWSENIFQGSGLYPQEIVQVIRKENPQDTPYRDKKNNIIIIETNEIQNFLDELKATLEVEQKSHEEKRKQLESLIEEIIGETSENAVNKFINEQEYRKSLLGNLLEPEIQIYFISPFLEFLSQCIDKTWEDSAPDGEFEPYNQNLSILLDIILNIELRKMPPALLEFVAYSLEKVLPFVGYSKGQSYTAGETWGENKLRIPKEMVDELSTFSERQSYYRLKSKLKELHNQ